MNIKEQINHYLNDEESLLKDWYRKQNAYETGVDFGPPVSSFDEYFKAFENWLQSHKKVLRERICPNRNKINSIQEPSQVILAIMQLIDDISFVGAVLQTAILIFNHGLDKLCNADDDSKS